MNGVDDDEMFAVGDEIDETRAERPAVGHLDVLGQGHPLERLHDAHAYAFVLHQDVADAENETRLHGVTSRAENRDGRLFH